jgi:hypothetical protein
MSTKKQQKSKRTKCTQTQAYDVELDFRKIWTLLSYFLSSYEFSKFKSYFEKERGERKSGADMWHNLVG